MKLSDVLDEIKSRNGLTANAELARLLDIDLRRIGEYYKGREPMDDDYPKIAMACGKRVDELQVLVKLSEENDEKSRAVWSRYYKSIGGYAASLMLGFFLVVTLIVTPTPAKAAPVLEKETQHFVLCKRLVQNIRAAIVAAARMLSTVVPRFGFSG